MGFVSNSSSSSFIIATKPDQSIKATVEIDIGELISYTITNKQELIDFFCEEYCFEEKDWDKYMNEDIYMIEQYEKMLKSINEGYYVHFGSATSESENGLELMICNEGINSVKFIDDVLIIEGEGGY